MSVHLALAMLKFYSEFRRQYIGNAEASARALSIQRDMDVCFCLFARQMALAFLWSLLALPVHFSCYGLGCCCVPQALDADDVALGQRLGADMHSKDPPVPRRRIFHDNIDCSTHVWIRSIV
jgi:hypothetical protein